MRRKRKRKGSPLNKMYSVCDVAREQWGKQPKNSTIKTGSQNRFFFFLSLASDTGAGEHIHTYDEFVATGHKTDQTPACFSLECAWTQQAHGLAFARPFLFSLFFSTPSSPTTISLLPLLSLLFHTAWGGKSFRRGARPRPRPGTWPPPPLSAPPPSPWSLQAPRSSP